MVKVCMLLILSRFPVINVLFVTCGPFATFRDPHPTTASAPDASYKHHQELSLTDG